MIKTILCFLLGHRWVSKTLESTRDGEFLVWERWCYTQAPFCVRCGKANPNIEAAKEGE